MSARVTKADLEEQLKKAETEANVYRELSARLLAGEKPVKVVLGEEVGDVWAHAAVWVIGGHRMHGGLCTVVMNDEGEIRFGTWWYASEWFSRIPENDIWGRAMGKRVMAECSRQLNASLSTDRKVA